MSNRFHPKYHRTNHHTDISKINIDGSPKNPDTGHDPIASREHPFLGVFCLNGGLSSVVSDTNTDKAAGIFIATKTTEDAARFYGSVKLSGDFIMQDDLIHADINTHKVGINLDPSIYNSTYETYDLIVNDSLYVIENTNTKTLSADFVRINTQGAYSDNPLNVINNLNNDHKFTVTKDGYVGVNLGSSPDFESKNLKVIGDILFDSTNKYFEVKGSTKINDSVASYTTKIGTNIYAGEVSLGRNGIVRLTTGSNLSAACDIIGTKNIYLTGNQEIQGNLKVLGNVDVQGTYTQLDTYVYVTSSVDITNLGTTTALVVTQTGNTDVADFKDETGTILFVDNDRRVGVLTNNPQYDLDVYGTIHTTDNVKINGNKQLLLGFDSENSVFDGASLGLEYISDTNSRLLIKTKNDGNEPIIFRQGAGNIEKNRLVIGSDGNIGIGFGPLTSVENFATNLTILGNISASDNLYINNGSINFTSPTSAHTINWEDNLEVFGVSNPTNSTSIHKTYTMYGATGTIINASQKDFILKGSGLRSFHYGTDAVTRTFLISGTPESPFAVPDGYIVAGLRGFAYNGNNVFNGYGTSGIGSIDIATDGLQTQYNAGGTLIFRTLSANVGTVVGSEERMRITSSGRVGIGTTSPTQKLHVVDSYASDQNGNALFASTGGNASIRIDSASTSFHAYQTLSQGGVGKFEFGIVPTSSDFYINPNVQSSSTGASIYVKKSDGFVGIGNTNPQSLLHVSTLLTGDQQLAQFTNPNVLTNETGYIVVGGNNSVNNGAFLGFCKTGTSTGYVNLTVRGKGGLVVNADGQVGIGTTIPSAKLDVSGDTRVNGITIGRGGNNSDTNTVVGLNSLRVNTGTQNTSVGSNTFYSNTLGNQNTAIGNGAIYLNTTGSRNTACGASAIQDNISGADNTAVGCYALFKNTASSNTACGQNALRENTTGSNNIALGDNAGASNTTGSNNLFIGASSSGTAVNVSNQVNIYNGSVTARFSGAAVGWTFTSDERDKKNIEDLTIGLDFIKQLKARKFAWDMRNSDVDKDKEASGFIAQEILQVVNANNAEYTGLVDASNSEQYTLTVTNLIPILVKAIQELSDEVKTLKDKLNEK